jgi:hypothetical protein
VGVSTVVLFGKGGSSCVEGVWWGRSCFVKGLTGGWVMSHRGDRVGVFSALRIRGGGL